MQLILSTYRLKVLSCQPRVTVTSCFVYKVTRDLESIVHLHINPICRIELIHISDLSIRVSSSEVYKFMLYTVVNNCKQNITPLSLLVGTTVSVHDQEIQQSHTAYQPHGAVRKRHSTRTATRHNYS